MPTNVRTDNRNYVSQFAAGTAIQPTDPVFLLPKGDPGMAPHFNTSLQIKNPSGTVKDHGTQVAHRHSLLGTPVHAPPVIVGRNVPVRQKENSFWSWAKNVFIEGRNVVMHAVETGVNSLWTLLPPAAQNVINNGSQIVKGMSLDDFKGAAEEELAAIQEFLTSPDAAIALAETLGLMAAQGIPVVGQIIGGAAAAQRIMAAAENVGAAVEQLKGMIGKWTQPMTPEQMAEARKELAKWLLASGMGLLLAAMGRAGAKFAAKLQARKNSSKPVQTGTGPPQAKTSCPCQTPSPVIIATGEKALKETDFELAGPIPLVWQRNYRSGNDRNGWFGRGWTTPLAVVLLLTGSGLVFQDAQGRSVDLPNVAVGQSHFEAYEKFTLARPDATTWTLTDKSGQTRHFRQTRSDQWELPLTTIADRDGNAIQLHYPKFDPLLPYRPTHGSDSGGRELLFSWNSDGHLTAIDVNDGLHRLRLATYHYQDGCIVRAEDGNGQGHTYGWKNQLLIGYQLATGERYAAEYDDYSPAGRVTRSWALDGNENWRFEYHPRARYTRVTDALGRTTTYYYDEREDIVGSVDACGQRYTTPRDSNGHQTEATDPLGRRISYQFDRRGNLLTVVDPAGNPTRLSYNEFDLPQTLTDAQGQVWRYEYDEHGHRTAATDPLGQTTRYVYGERGWPTAIVDAKGGTKRLSWSPRGDLTAYTDCSGHTTQFAFDSLGRLATVVDALSQTSRYQYDAAGRLIAHQQSDGAIHRFTYDGEGNLTSYTDPLGAVTQYRYNGNGDPIERTDAHGGRLSYHYDAGNRLVGLINENGALYQFRYDPLDRLTDEIGFDGRHQRYVYNAAGELTHLIEAGHPDAPDLHTCGKVTHLERDVLGRLISKRYEGRPESETTKFDYDALGRLKTAVNPAVHLSFAYDAIGQLLQETQKLRLPNGDAREYTLKHDYDPLGYRLRSLLPSGRQLEYLLYGSGHLHGLVLDGETLSDFTRDSLHRETSRTQGKLTSHFDYDPMGRLLHQRALRYDVDPQTKQRLDTRLQPILRQYSYDAAGQLSRIIDQHRGQTDYGYDRLGRLLSAARHGAQGSLRETFAFDPAHNLLPSGSLPSDGVIGDNRLRVYQDLRFDYDAHGNCTTRRKGAHETIHFTYDPGHQLIRADIERHGVRQAVDYYYDALGRRVAKTDAFGVTWFAWDGDRMVLEQRGAKVTDYLFEPDKFVPFAKIENSTERRLQDDPYRKVYTRNEQIAWGKANSPQSAPEETYEITTSAQVYYFQNDHLGTPQELTATDGSVVWRVTYKAWGAIDRKEIAEIGQPLRFQGQYFDAETGLHYNRFRYYDPEVGRFTSQDPIALLGGENFYRYAPNPVDWIDPYGLANGRAVKQNLKAAGRPCPKWYAGHHLIPEHLEDHPILKEAKRRGIYDINRAQNGVGLPTRAADSLSSGKPLHSGNHLGSYYDAAANRLDAISAANPNLSKLSDSQLLSEIGKVENAMKADLESGKLRLQTTDPRAPGTTCTL